MSVAKFSAAAWVQATVAWNSEAGLPVLGTTSLEGQPWQTRTSTQSDAASGPATDGSCPRECPDGLTTPGLPPSATLPRLNVPLGGSAVLPLGLASVGPGQTHAVAVRGRHEFRSRAADPSPCPRMDSDPGPYRAHDDPTAPRVNRFAADLITLHLFATIFWLAHVSNTPCVQLHHVHHRPHQISAGYSGSTFALPPAPH